MDQGRRYEAPVIQKKTFCHVKQAAKYEFEILMLHRLFSISRKGKGKSPSLVFVGASDSDYCRYACYDPHKDYKQRSKSESCQCNDHSNIHTEFTSWFLYGLYFRSVLTPLARCQFRKQFHRIPAQPHPAVRHSLPLAAGTAS